MVRALFACFFACAVPLLASPEKPEAIATEILAPLLDPAKVATLKGDRPVNGRFYRVLFWLETARRAGGDVSGVMDAAQLAAGYGGTARAKADARAILANRQTLQDFGCFTPEGLAELKRGGSPKITEGEHAGENLALDHVLPVSIVPELAARFFNLNAMTAKQNLAKGARITKREKALARQWNRDGLLSAAGLLAVESAP